MQKEVSRKRKIARLIHSRANDARLSSLVKIQPVHLVSFEPVRTYALFASPLARARLLAEALGTPRLDPRLKEIHFGEWEGRSYDDIGQAALDAWVAEPLDFAPPGGESPRQMAERALDFLADLRAAGPAAAVVVAHGGPLRALAGELLGLPPERWLGLDFGCGEVTRLDLHDWGTVLRWFNR